MTNPHSNGAGPLRIVVVEDNVDAAMTLKDLLEFEGHEVQVAHSGQAALDVIRQWRPHVVLCDIGLPGMDGYQVAAAVRAERALSGVRLIALSGYSEEEDRQQSLQAGFDLHLVKPVDPEKLQRVLTAARGA